MKTRIITTFVSLLVILATWSCILLHQGNALETKFPTSTMFKTNAEQEITPTSQKLIYYKQVALRCRTYFRAQWGTGPNEFGDRRSFYDQNIVLGPEPPFFDDQGFLYVADPANHRVLKFINSETIPQPIPISSSYVLDYGNRKIYWNSAQITGNRLFLIFYYRSGNKVGVKLAALTLDGQEEKVFELDSVATPSFNFSPKTLVDRRGAIFLLIEPNGVLYYNVNLQSEWSLLGKDWPYWETIIGWDRNLYTYLHQADRVDNWGNSEFDNIINRQPVVSFNHLLSSVPAASITSEHILGVSSDGRYYFSFRDQDENLWLVRFFATSELGELAKAPVEWSSRTTSIALSPDGSLYGLIVDRNNVDINPQIEKCDFSVE